MADADGNTIGVMKAGELRSGTSDSWANSSASDVGDRLTVGARAGAGLALTGVATTAIVGPVARETWMAAAAGSAASPCGITGGGAGWLASTSTGTGGELGLAGAVPVTRIVTAGAGAAAGSGLAWGPPLLGFVGGAGGVLAWTFRDSAVSAEALLEAPVSPPEFGGGVGLPTWTLTATSA